MDTAVINSHQLFLQMEEERSRSPNVLREDFIPTFIVNLLRSHLCCSEQSTIQQSTSRGKPTENLPERHVSPMSSENWTDDSLMEELADFESSFLIPDEKIGVVNQVLTFAVDVVNMFGVDVQEFWKIFYEGLSAPSLELLFLMDKEHELLPLNNYLMLLSRQKIHIFQRQLLNFCYSSIHFDLKLRDRCSRILSHFLQNFLVTCYCISVPAKSSSLENLRVTAYNILLQLSMKLTSTRDCFPEMNRNLILEVIQKIGVPNSLKLKYCTDQLFRLMTADGKDAQFKQFSLSDVIKFQERFVGQSFLSDVKSFHEFVKAIMGPHLPAQDAMKIVSSAIQSNQQDWNRILIFNTEWLRVAEFGAVSLLKDFIKAQMNEGISKSNVDKVSVAFIVARHCSLASPPRVFPRYEIWYSEMFNEQNTPAKDAETFNFLANLLSEWIPFEPNFAVQVHATFWPYIPKAVECRVIWKTYVDMAKARVAEYNEVEEAMGPELNPNNPVLHEVEVAIRDYEKTKNIPLNVDKMFLFSKKYYLDHFLPTLLKKPPGTSLSDARLRLIEALNQKNKIPREMYVAYKGQRNVR